MPLFVHVILLDKNEWQELDLHMGMSLGDLEENLSCFPSIENAGLSSGFSLKVVAE